jgi:hypothetical protein
MITARRDVIAAHLPEELRALAAQRDRVVPLLLALLLDTQPAVADKQGDEIAARMGKTTAVEARTLQQDAVASLHPVLRLPLASLAFPVLRRRAATGTGRVPGYRQCDGLCRRQRLPVRVLPGAAPHRACARVPGPVPLRALRPSQTERRAQRGHLRSLPWWRNAAIPMRKRRRQAFLAGMLRVLPDQPLPYMPRTDGVLALDEVWVPLGCAGAVGEGGAGRRITATISHDGRIDIAEAELLRTICSVLHCPLPPLLGQQ